MRCSRKSTTWPANAVFAWLACAVAVPAAAQGVAPAPPGCSRADVAPAVAATVRALVGGEAAIHVNLLMCDVSAGAEIETAIVEPGARLGRPVRVRLMSRSRQVGHAVAVASGAIRHVRTSRPVSGGTPIVEADLVVVTAEVTGVLIEPLPGVEDVVGARAVRALAAGEIVTGRVVRTATAVRSGDRVVVRATLGTVQISGVATAQQSGAIGDVIRLVNRDSRRALRGRITGKGEVEVVHGS